MSRTRKVHVKSFGCQMNVYDSHRMADTLAPAGYSETAEASDADLVILNTCNIREKAAEKVYSEIGRIRELKEEAAVQGRRMLIAVAGCVAQAEGQEIVRRAGAVDLVVGSQNYHLLPELLDRAERGERIVDTEFPVDDKFDVLAAPRSEAIRKRGISAFVTVQEGCDKFCTFCVVPYTRGAEVSRPVEKIAAEVERLAQAGVREVTLIGQNVNAYHGQDVDGRPATLGRLLRRLAKVPGIVRLRYMTSHPRDMDDDLIAAHGDLPALMPYVHLPVQSGSDRILAAMNRRHTRQDYLDVIAALRARRVDLAFTSDFIVGFPGETEDDFRATLTLVEEVGFATAYSFIYSARPGTPAAEMDAQVPPEEQADRLQRLQAVITRQWRAFNAQSLRPHCGSAAGEAGQAPWAIGRPHPIFAGSTGHGAALGCRFAGAGRHHRNRQQYAVRLAHRANSCAGPRRSRSLRIHLRTSDPAIPAAAASEETATTQIVLAFEDNRLASILFGQYGQNLALIERRLGVVAEQRGNHVTIDGSRGGCEQARRVLEGLYENIKRGHELVARRRRGRHKAGDRARLAVRLRPGERAAGFRGNQSAQTSSARAHRRAGRLYPRAQAPSSGVRHGTCRHRQDLARGRASDPDVRAQGSRPHHPVAAGGGSRRDGSAFCPATCARRSTLICARSTTRSTT